MREPPWKMDSPAIQAAPAVSKMSEGHLKADIDSRLVHDRHAHHRSPWALDGARHQVSITSG